MIYASWNNDALVFGTCCADDDLESAAYGLARETANSIDTIASAVFGDNKAISCYIYFFVGSAETPVCRMERPISGLRPGPPPSSLQRSRRGPATRLLASAEHEDVIKSRALPLLQVLLGSGSGSEKAAAGAKIAKEVGEAAKKGLQKGHEHLRRKVRAAAAISRGLSYAQCRAAARDSVSESMRP